MNITVFLGAAEGNNPKFKECVAELGSWFGKTGNTLVYGGSKTGLMGVLATSAIQAGAEVIGVETTFFVEQNVHFEQATKLIIEDDLSKRKDSMINAADAFIIFPGGNGTLDEASDVMAKASLGHIDAPCIFYNIDGYYNSLKDFLQNMIDCGFSTKNRQRTINFASSLEEIEEILQNFTKSEMDKTSGEAFRDLCAEQLGI